MRKRVKKEEKQKEGERRVRNALPFSLSTPPSHVKKARYKGYINRVGRVGRPMSVPGIYKREGNVLYLTVRVLIADFGLT